MKRIIFSGLALAFIMSGGMALAQNNANGYTDDVYYNGSKASDAADQQAVDESGQNDDTDAAYDNGTGQNYQDSDYANNDDSQYIDYDDDSYTSRIRRFYYPMASAGYWGGVYAPLWMNSYYPYYGWGSGWYGPGFSLSFGWNPFWADNWYYGGGGWYGAYYSPFYNPYFGYGGGYWNGYYDGWYNGHNNGYAGRYSYAPRGLRQSGGVRGIGNYGRNSRTTPLMRTSNTVTPQRATASPRLIGMENTGNRPSVNGGIRLGRTRVYNNNLSGGGSQRALDMDRGQSSPVNNTNTEVRTNRRFFRFNRDNDNSRPVSEQRTEIYSSPARSSEPSRNNYTPPARNYNTPSRSDYSAPSRSYSAPSRSGGGGSSRSMRR